MSCTYIVYKLTLCILIMYLHVHCTCTCMCCICPPLLSTDRVGVGQISSVREPAAEVVVGTSPCDVVHHQSPSSSSVVAPGHSSAHTHTHTHMHKQNIWINVKQQNVHYYVHVHVLYTRPPSYTTVYTV